MSPSGSRGQEEREHDFATRHREGSVKGGGEGDGSEEGQGGKGQGGAAFVAESRYEGGARGEEEGRGSHFHPEGKEGPRRKTSESQEADDKIGKAQLQVPGRDDAFINGRNSRSAQTDEDEEPRGEGGIWRRDEGEGQDEARQGRESQAQ